MRAKNKIISKGHSAEAASSLALTDTETRINDNPPSRLFARSSLAFAEPPFRAKISRAVSVIYLPSYQPGEIIRVKYPPGTNDVAIIGAI